jgi:hypothetical protein
LHRAAKGAALAGLIDDNKFIDFQSRLDNALKAEGQLAVEMTIIVRGALPPGVVVLMGPKREPVLNIAQSSMPFC